jgi:F-type H+-transporting ATPase subunit delta
VIERTLAKRYAAALLRVTDLEGSTEETEALLLALKEALARQKSFREILRSPRVPRAIKKKVLRRPFESIAKRSFLDFLDLLVDKNRVEIIPDVADMYDRLADASKGVVKVKVRSWRPLSEAQRLSLHDRLVRLVGKKVKIEAEADPALLGGLLVNVGDDVIDGTVAHRLKALGERFLELDRR